MSFLFVNSYFSEDIAFLTACLTTNTPSGIEYSDVTYLNNRQDACFFKFFNSSNKLSLAA